MSDAAPGIPLSLAELDAPARDALTGAGLAPDRAAAAAAVAATMVAGECDGFASHGIHRLLVAANSSRAGGVMSDAVPVVSQQARSLVRADGGGVAKLAFLRGLLLLIDAAPSHAIAAVALNNVVHFAALWPEVEAIAGEGRAALAFMPSHAWVAPAGGTRPAFGTNSIAFGWMRPGGAPSVCDFATSAVAHGEISLHRRAGQPIPYHWDYDAAGGPGTDAEAVLAGEMGTFGGRKGSTLAALVELLASPLNADITNAASLAADGGRGGSPISGELIMAIDPAGFLGGAIAEQLARAVALFAAVGAQGAGPPSARRHAAHTSSMADGVTIPAALHADILRMRQ